MSLGASFLPSASSTPYLTSSPFSFSESHYPTVSSPSTTTTTTSPAPSLSSIAENTPTSAPLLPRSSSSPDPPRLLSISSPSTPEISSLSSSLSPDSPPASRRISTPTPLTTDLIIKKVLRKSLQARSSADYTSPSLSQSHSSPTPSPSPAAIITNSANRRVSRTLEAQDSTSSSEDFYYNNYHCQLSSPTQTTTSPVSPIASPRHANSPPFFSSPQLSIEMSPISKYSNNGSDNNMNNNNNNNNDNKRLSNVNSPSFPQVEQKKVSLLLLFKYYLFLFYNHNKNTLIEADIGCGR